MTKVYLVFGSERYEGSWVMSAHRTRAAAEDQCRILQAEEDEGDQLVYYSVRERDVQD